jgi:hypothetical protein
VTVEVEIFGKKGEIFSTDRGEGRFCGEFEGFLMEKETKKALT